MDRKENRCKFKASLGYVVTGHPATQRDSVSKLKEKGAIKMVHHVNAPKPEFDPQNPLTEGEN